MKTSPHTPPLQKGLIVYLCLAIFLCGCGHSIVQIRPPYQEKIRVGDGVKITVQDGTIHSGRVAYLDKNIVVVRTPRQTVLEKPIKSSKFGTTIPWESVKIVKVAGVLDSQKRLVSNEEIRVNLRTKQKRNMFINMGLLGLAVSFLVGVKIQDSISPASIDVNTHNHSRARIAFWTTFIGGALTSALAGYKVGERMDIQKAIARIERQRFNAKSESDSLSVKAKQYP